MMLEFPVEEELANAIMNALKPDDEYPPKGFEIKTFWRKGGLKIEICSSKTLSWRDFLTFLSLADEYSRLTESIIMMLSEIH